MDQKSETRPVRTVALQNFRQGVSHPQSYDPMLTQRKLHVLQIFKRFGPQLTDAMLEALVMRHEPDETMPALELAAKAGRLETYCADGTLLKFVDVRSKFRLLD